MTGGELLFECLQRALQAGFRQRGSTGQGGVHLVQAEHVAPDQARGGGCAVTAQLCGPVLRLRRVQARHRQRRRVWLCQVGEQCRLAGERVHHEVTGQRYACQRVLNTFGPRRIGRQGVADARHGPLDQSGQRRRGRRNGL